VKFGAVIVSEMVVVLTVPESPLTVMV
jgi:hypothetical protein